MEGGAKGKSSGDASSHGHGNTVGETPPALGQTAERRKVVRAMGPGAGALGRDGSRAARLGGGERPCCLLALLGGLTWYGLRPDWRTLYVNLEPDDARQTRPDPGPGADFV